ncbi:MAG: hypothetical protein K2N90_10900 [Lachnospiraceae bacterium]|nr:hypothetical protein [Lachnospiraceae bacterium]
MKKKLICMAVILFILCFNLGTTNIPKEDISANRKIHLPNYLGTANIPKENSSKKQNTEENLQITEESNSEKWITEECQKIIHDKEEAFGFDFTLAASEFEDKIQGVWQVKEFVGWDDSSRYQWDGFYGDIVIFCEKAWIEDGSPWNQPVYACYTAKVNELEDPLRITWSDNRYKGKKAVLTMGVCTERNKKFSESRDGETILFLLIDDVIVMERNGSYWELEKVGDIEMSDALSNVSDT